MPTILVADDNSNIQKMVSLVFQEKGINVVAVGNGEAACRKVPEVRPDIVLADVFMPVRNGYEVCEFVKRDSRFSETPVVLLVGAFDPLDEKEARRVGADGVLKKPFVPPEPLISLVGSLLQKSEKSEEPAAGASIAETPAPPPVSVAPPPAPPRSYQGYESEPEPAPPRGYQAEPEPEGKEDQFTYGTASRDSDVAEHMSATGKEPMATPPPAEEEPQDDVTESASDWKRRRLAMDYEIPTEESANLVEHLAGEDGGSFEVKEAQAESEPAEQSIEESSAPVEAEEHNEPQTEDAAPEPSRVPASEWSSYVPSASGESSAPASEPGKDQEIPLTSEPAPVSYASRSGVDDEIEKDGERDLKPSEFIATKHHEERDDFPTAPPSIIPFPNSSEEDQPEVVAVEELNSDEGTPAPEPAFPVEDAPTAQAAVEQAVHEAIAQPEAAKQAPMDQATIDSIVAKVVEKLEPQLHQALSQGVLKPLVQELLKGELKPDK